MANPPKRCIFCGGFGMTKEHVLPDWLRAIFPRLPTDTHTMGVVEWVHLPTVGIAPLATRKRGQGQAGSKKVKVVCKGCNIGWLSTMEDVTKPTLERLVYGETGVVTVADQRQLATWIAKTTMTAEFLMPKEVAIKQSEREEFRLRRDPGAHWQIWIALYVGERRQAGAIAHHGVGLYLPPKPVRKDVKNTQYTVIGLGRLLAISFSSEEDRLSFTLNDQIKVAVRQIWPPTGNDMNWPPEWSVDDAAAEAIVGGFWRAFGLEVPAL
jgi:hypothetical protein